MRGGNPCPNCGHDWSVHTDQDEGPCKSSGGCSCPHYKKITVPAFTNTEEAQRWLDTRGGMSHAPK